MGIGRGLGMGIGGGVEEVWALVVGVVGEVGNYTLVDTDYNSLRILALE